MAGPTFGFHCSHEQHAPSTLLRNARLAAAAGFTAAMCSDHFHPWSERQGHSGFAWSWLGAALEATPLSFGTVCAPGQRYQPATIAQAAATLAEMYPDRFWLAVGSGEALNENITGTRWPSRDERNARLKASVDAMRRLWAGESVTIKRAGVRIEQARLYVRAARAPMIVAAALSPETARWAAPWADALITTTAPRDAMRAVLDAFREGGGAPKPVFLQATLSFAPTDAAALAAAHDQWRQSALTRDQLSDLATPAEFDRATTRVTPVALASRVRISSDIERHAAWLHEDAAMGFDRIYLHNVARDHEERFIAACGERLLPALTHVD
ncbi:MAG: TIGR03885 family FMN-dependent LLM class oxidoreductase [Vicinamibacterales bacterium]